MKNAKTNIISVWHKQKKKLNVLEAGPCGLILNMCVPSKVRSWACCTSGFYKLISFYQYEIELFQYLNERILEFFFNLEVIWISHNVTNPFNVCVQNLLSKMFQRFFGPSVNIQVKQFNGVMTTLIFCRMRKYVKSRNTLFEPSNAWSCDVATTETYHRTVFTANLCLRVWKWVQSCGVPDMKAK